ncbi:DUF397 domain-containing protein [Actinophytocola sp.]|jgi:uncharacterized protein DUF397|uniref:DUF397 domain-containing protein n=1 Tax=Actinophytocola sp. TaxID=1872138 RepID=UPI002D70AA55|nr:DUF397 domain-containing protein [Actinophytocola sp.]HYQ67253.1 DUF397 domain-containing protein [Actinophytocola sp.]
MISSRFTQWRKSTFSNLSPDNCVEVGVAPGLRAVRDTKTGTSSPILVFSGENWCAFVGAARSGS